MAAATSASTSKATAGPQAGAGAAAEAPKSFAKRDRLATMQEAAQAWWDEEHLYEQDAPTSSAEDAVRPPKYMATFPYPYMNGRLHLGHAFTVTKAEFAARYQRLHGKRSLFPFAFHCTGMPIQAAANKLKRELAEAASAQARAAIDTTDGGDAIDASSSTAAAAATGAATPSEAATAEPGRFKAVKSKVKAKGGGMTQTQILRSLNIPDEEIPKFQDPMHWLTYFPPLGKEDLRGFGVAVDWRRSFITTDANPFYNSFIRWQFNTLRKQDRIAFGKRPTIYSPLDGQACADHDRASGEGVGPQEYTLIKMQVVRDAEGKLPGALGQLEQEGKQRNVFFVAATLRPETMYGQTNCFLLPDGEYGAFEIDSEGTVFLCSERSARNMSYQGMSKEEGKLDHLANFTGQELLGIAIKAPNAQYDQVYTLPLLTISMYKGTGVVTSVPSDAPDDFAALRDLKEKPKLREKFGITDEMVLPFDPVEIIDIPEFGRRAAETLCKELGIKSQNDKEKLATAKEKVYLKGFYEGVLLVGSCSGMKVHEAKSRVREEMIAAGHALVYWEPEKEVVSRTGDECVVAHLDQWYLKYGEEDWREQVERHVKSEHFSAYSSAAKSMYLNTLAWLKEWACSRNFGLGTRMPWDEQFVIESLSDSTIYMAYYTIAHLLQGGSLDGSAGSPVGIEPEQLTDAVWDFIYLEGAYPENCGIAKDVLVRLRQEFEYWYPLDLRVSGKDLINNHLTMSLYNHASIWGGRTDRMPQSFYTNGHVLVNGEKMAKQKGNFITVTDAMKRWTADPVRMALADAGDGLDDANFETQLGDTALLRLSTEEEFFVTTLESIKAGVLREGGEPVFADQVFEARMQSAAIEGQKEFDQMRFKLALKVCFWDMLNIRDDYRDTCVKLEIPMRKDLITTWLSSLCIMLAPIAPHWTDFVWREHLKQPDGIKSVHQAHWPQLGEPDESLLAAGYWLNGQLHQWRVAVEKDLLRRVVGGKAKTGMLSSELQAKVSAAAQKTELKLYVAPGYALWQEYVLNFLQQHFDPSTNSFPRTITKDMAANFAKGEGAAMLESMNFANGAGRKRFLNKTVMPFVGTKMRAAQAQGPDALSTELPFNEIDLLRNNLDYVTKSVGVAKITVVDAFSPEVSDDPNASRALVGAPAYALVVEDE